MITKPCEVCITTTDGNSTDERECRSPAHINVNGFPMCAGHFAEYEAEDLVESVELFAEPQSAPRETPQAHEPRDVCTRKECRGTGPHAYHAR